MAFEPLYAPSLKELFVQKLQGMILSGELSQGEKLPSERELCQQMGVSRAVINAGITELARRGFLEVLPRQGTFVADYRRNGNMDTLMAIMEYNGSMLGKEEIRVRLIPASTKAGTMDSYDTGTVRSDGKSALNYFAIRYNK